MILEIIQQLGLDVYKLSEESKKINTFTTKELRNEHVNHRQTIVEESVIEQVQS